MPVEIKDQTGTTLVFHPATFTRNNEKFAYTQPDGANASEARFRGGIHPRERTWGAFLRAIRTGERKRFKLTCLFLGRRLTVVLRTDIVNAKCTFAAVRSQSPATGQAP